MKIDPQTFKAKFGNRESEKLTASQFRLASVLLQKYPDHVSEDYFQKKFNLNHAHLKVVLSQLKQKLIKIGVSISLIRGQANMIFLPDEMRKVFCDEQAKRRSIKNNTAN